MRYLQVLTLLFILVNAATAGQQPCTVCSVEQEKILLEECDLSETFQGQAYFFCRSGCRDEFLKEPVRWSEALVALREKSEASHEGKAGVGDPLPTFRFPLEPLGSVSSDDLEGKVVLLNFWAGWCAPCKAEMPDLVKLQEELSDRGLVVLAVSFDRTREDHNRARTALKLNFPSVYANQPEIQDFLKKLTPVEEIPVTLVIDRQGKIVERIDGPVYLEKFRSLVTPHLQTPERTSMEQTGALVPS